MATLKELTDRLIIKETNIAELGITYGSIRHNSLECREGDIFVAVKGSRFDGHDFICTAYERGAKIIVCTRITEYLKKHPDIPYILVDDTEYALSHMWNEHCERPSERMIFVAVTGTNGKTSITYFLREIFKKAGYVTGVIGTVKCLIGDETVVLTDSEESHVNAMTTPTPDKLYPVLSEMADAGVEIVFMEASSHALIQQRLAPLRFYTGIFTGLTGDHLDYHGTMNAYYKAKLKLFSMCDTAVINADGAYAGRLMGDVDIPYVTYSTQGRNADITASCAMFTSVRGISYTYSDNNDSCEVTCPVPGSFTVANTLAAVCTARLFKIKPDVVSDALADCPQIPGRMEHMPLPEGCDFDVFIDFAHTPDALENVLRCLLGFKHSDGRLVCLFGCGGDRDRSKRPVMGRIATELANLTIITGDNSRSENPRSIICDILRGTLRGADCKVIENREKAICYAIENHRPGDIILLAGKGHEDYNTDSLGKHPFSEKDIVQKAAERLMCRKP